MTFRTSGWLMRVLSFPSVYAPAPPSPKFMLLSGSRLPSRMSRVTSFLRWTTSRPRSRSTDGTPRSRSPSAQKRPAGPVPTMIGRRSGERTFDGGGGGGSVSVTPGGSRAGARPSANATSTVWI